MGTHVALGGFTGPAGEKLLLCNKFPSAIRLRKPRDPFYRLFCARRFRHLKCMEAVKHFYLLSLLFAGTDTVFVAPGTWFA